MKKRWNTMGKMAVCSFAAVMMVMIGTGLKANAEAVIDTEEEIKAVCEMVPESESTDVLPAKAPAEEEAGETEFNVMEIVVIEDNLIPAAAKPDLDASGKEEGEAKEQTDAKEKAAGADEQTGAREEAAGDQADAKEETTGADEQAEAGEETAGADEKAGAAKETAEDEKAGDEAAQEEADEPQDADQAGDDEPETIPETCVPETITYEDSEVSITVTTSEAAQLPADTEVKVTRLAEGSAEYEEAKEAARQSVGAGENASYAFYSVTLESEGQVLDVEEGTVSVKMELKAEDSTEKEVVKIERTENGKVAHRVTGRMAAGRAGAAEFLY